MKTIQLSHGQVSVVDDADYEVLSRYRWFVYQRDSKSCMYAVSHLASRKVAVRMHRIILDAPTGVTVDHIDGDGLNNQRCNLRLATRNENQWNRGPRTDNKSGFKGVSFHKPTGKWRATVTLFGEANHLGLFARADDADRVCREFREANHGRFARSEAFERRK